MVPKNRSWDSLVAVFRIHEDKLTQAVGERVQRALCEGGGQDERINEAAAEAWTEPGHQGRVGSGGVHAPAVNQFETANVVFDIFEPSPSDHPRSDPGLEAGPSDRVRSFHVQPSSLSPRSLPRRKRLVAERLIEVFDVLQPSVGIADTPYRLPEAVRPEEGHRNWLTFLGPDRGDEARALADPPGAELHERDWGGYVIQAWEDPFEPEGPAVPGTNLRAWFVEPSGVQPNACRLLAGVSVDEPWDEEGRPLLELFLEGDLGPQPIGLHVESVRERLVQAWRADRLSLGPGTGLQAFAEVFGWDAVVGLPITRQDRGEGPLEKGVPVTGDEVEEALTQADEILSSLGSQASADLHVVWSGNLRLPGPREGGWTDDRSETWRHADPQSWVEWEEIMDEEGLGG